MARGRHPQPKKAPIPASQPLSLAPPDSLVDEAARKHWLMHAVEWERLGVLNRCTVDGFVGYCMTVSELLDCERDIREKGSFYESITQTGSVIERRRPVVGHLLELRRQLRMWLESLGLNQHMRPARDSNLVESAPVRNTPAGPMTEREWKRHKAKAAERLLR